MKRWNSMVITILFLLFLFGIAAAGLLLPDRKFSQMENRYLKLQPDWSLHRMMNGLWMDEMEDYLSDQIAGRDLWICLQGWSERLSGKKENNGVYFGKKDTLISRVEEPNERLLFQNVDYVNSLSEQVGVPVSFGLIPTKAAIWADRLPDFAPTADEYAWIQKAYERSEVQNLDFYQALYSHGEEPVYYRTDHHWTSLGALYGADTIRKAWGLPGIRPEDYQSVQVSDSFYGSDWSSAAAVWTAPDSMERYVSDEGISVTI
ncbi:MAG: DHHW family protein, partial [Lachnospiraceae bacterium]